MPVHVGKSGTRQKEKGHGGGTAAPGLTPSQQHNSTETKREEFRKYLEKTRVLDVLTRVLVGLYEEHEKPANPIEYFLDKMATGVPLKEQFKNLNSELIGLQDRLREVDEENVVLRSNLGKYESVKPADGDEEEEGEEEGEKGPEPEVVPATPAPSLQIN